MGTRASTQTRTPCRHLYHCFHCLTGEQANQQCTALTRLMKTSPDLHSCARDDPVAFNTLLVIPLGILRGLQAQGQSPGA